MSRRNDGSEDQTTVRNAVGWADPWDDAGATSPSLAERAALARAEEALFGGLREVRVGRYRIERLIGRGMFGAVYAAVDEKLDRTVALKLQRTAQAGDVEDLRPAREARALARLDHPNVVRVFDVGAHEDRLYIVMELIEGSNLRGWLDEPRSPREILAVFEQAAAGLSAIHRAGLVHRDFKPDNVMVDRDGIAKVTDLGLARRLEDEETAISSLGIDAPMDVSLTATGAIMGTPAYMAPELLAGGRADSRSDQYAFCVALYEALYGRRPFSGNRIDQQQAMLAEQFDEPPAERRQAVACHEVIVRGLRADPESRWPSMSALASALHGRRARWPRWVAAMGLLVVGALGVGSSLGGGSPPSCVDVPRPWDPATASAVHARVGSDESWDRLERAASDYRTDWIAAYDQVCPGPSTPGGNAPDQASLSRLCLSEAQARFGAIVAAVDDADALGRAETAVRRLRPPQSCLALTEGGVPPAPPEDQAERIEEIRYAMAAAGIELPAERVRETLQALYEEAEAIGYEPLLAELHDALATASTRLGDAAAAQQHWEQGLAFAERSGHAVIAAETAGLLCQTAPDWGKTRDQAQRRCDEAVAAAERSGRPELLLGTRAQRAGTMATLGDNVEALAELEEILAAQRELVGDVDPYTLDTMLALSSAAEHVGDAKRAVELNRELVAAISDLKGTQHAIYFSMLDRLGSSIVASGRPAEALPLYTEAYEGCRVTRGELAPDCRIPLVNRADAYIQLEQPELARADLETALAMPGTVAPDTTAFSARINLGAVVLASDPAGALDLLGAVVDDARSQLGEQDVVTVKALELSGVAALELGRLDDAHARLDASFEAAKVTYGPRGRETVEIGLWLVRAELARGESDAARRRLAEVEEAAVGCDDPRLIDEVAAVRAEAGL